MSLASWADKRGGGGAFDEDAHPRDEQGRFTDGGGAGGGKDATVVRATEADRAYQAKIDKANKESKRTFTSELPKGLKKETWMGHYDKNPAEGGKPNDDRYKDVHVPIIREALNVPKPEPGEHKIAIVTMGAPASGKSSGLRNVDTSHMVKVDPDAIKEKIPEYKAALDPKNTFTGAAAMSHEESSAIGKEIMNRALAEGKHVLVDGTGINAKSMSEKLEKLKSAGYKVHLVMSHSTLEEGLKRAGQRAEKTGRVVPEHIIREGYEKVPKNFQEIAKHADSFAVHDATKPGSPLVWEKKLGGAEVHHDRQFVESFKKAHFKA